ncbi:dipeptide ABC transporter ATP-binding protein [Halotalea alkalilenta]|uniref:dipeptide ABC transporter ATP-binding protein n=1 Tax=Halotalea alkalilenta TaxID=376489 RepID=UPI00048544E0|nr:ABC transporter ATP-binding protein [Halotalea alkalilenta]
MTGPVLEIERYTLDYQTGRSTLRVLDDISLDISAGEVVGLVGESGSGKSSLAWAIMRHLAGNARERGGQLRLDGEDLRGLSSSRLQALRGSRLAMIFQDPSAALNPTLSIGEQVAEVLVRHQGLSLREAWARGVALLGGVELKSPEAMMRRYPHELSGGEKQRVLISTAFACRPRCLIFDEPTTALDVISAAQILALFTRLREETGVSALYISHDLALVSRVADRVAILERGRLVESAPAATIFSAPAHEYTRRLVSAVPDPARRLIDQPPASATALLEIHKLGVSYGRPGFVDRLFGRASETTQALRELTMTLSPAEVVGVVGESGSGKSSLAKALVGLTPFAGEIRFEGRVLSNAAGMNRAYRRQVQMVFQHPDASLNPRQRIGEQLARPLRLYGLAPGESEKHAVARWLEEVRLPAEFASRYPHELSGGQKQRVAIARAFAARPALVICDEITAALDVSVQATVIELLLELRKRHGTAYLFITHDLNLVRQIAHRIAVMYRGDLVEMIDAATLDARGASHPYTRALLEAVPRPLRGHPAPSSLQGTP